MISQNPKPMRVLIGFVLACFVVSFDSNCVRADDSAEFFEKKVRPLFAKYCYACHSTEAKKSKGGLTLDSVDGLRQGGVSGEAFKANDEKSLLLLAITHAGDVSPMPPKGKLSDAEIADLQKWIMSGAPLPATIARKESTTETARSLWSIQPLSERSSPKVVDTKWPVRKIDSFILEKLETQKLSHAPAAEKRKLIRRISFDLIGLPPTYEQVESFVADSRSDAYERLVEELLASPRFGEKWARHWLDVARYAEDNSTSEATCKPPRFPYRYRDWVIEAFNRDVPYDRFVRLQLAADLLPGTIPTDYAALGFLGLSPVYHKEPKLSKDVITGFVADEWDERVDVITRGFLGLTVACARCHDHKFDPISAKDYYALAGIMANTQLAERPIQEKADAAQDALTTVRLNLLDTSMRLGYAKEMRDTAKKEKADPTPFEKQAKELEQKVAQLKADEKKLDTGPIANVVRDAGTSVNGDDPAWTTIDYRPGQYRDLPVFVRGDPTRPGEVVPRRFLTVLSTDKSKPFSSGSGRRELADAIVGDAAGLSARVFVNRMWGWVFGRPLVNTPSNFGTLGERPSHPELLDDLAARFVANGWSIKWLIREMVLSATYRQSSRHDEKAVIADPDNRWLWRASRKRLELEAWRDGILQISGQLNLAGGGPSDNLDQSKNLRRTVYGRVSRDRASDIHRLFDLPDPKTHGEKRETTTTPLQQLYFLNSPLVRQASQALAKKVVGKSKDEGVNELFHRVYLRDATSEERELAYQLIATDQESGDPKWELLAQSLLVSNEFLFLN